MTRTYRAGTPADGQHEVEYFWSQVDQLTAADWPPGVVPPLFRDRGTAGFPDGAGLYRRIGEPLPRFPVGGVMFVGHNTDAEGRHASRRINGRSPGEPGNPVMPTWIRLYEICRRAELDLEDRSFFFTNAYVGLKEGNDPLGKFQGAVDTSFRDWCSAFLDDQIQVMHPRAVVALGRHAQAALGWSTGFAGRRTRAGIEFNAAGLMHPSSGWLYRKMKGSNELWIDHEARVLRQVVFT